MFMLGVPKTAKNDMNSSHASKPIKSASAFIDGELCRSTKHQVNHCKGMKSKYPCDRHSIHK